MDNSVPLNNIYLHHIELSFNNDNDNDNDNEVYLDTSKYTTTSKIIMDIVWYN